MKSRISTREQQIIQLIAYEHNSKEIAQQLYISEHTVMSHRKNLNLKLDVRNSAGLVRRAFEMGLLKLQLIVFFAVLSSPSISLAQDIIYVDHQAIGAENGKSWPSAYRALSGALDVATFGDSIFISEGTYMPPDTGRLSSFILSDGLTIVGGFDPHNGVSDYDDITRFFSNKVLLSGDIGIVGDSSDNSYHVLMDKNPGSLLVGTRIIGVQICEGLANGHAPNDSGGGILIRGGRLDIYESTLEFNGAQNDGSGIYSEGTRLNMVDCTISNNYFEDEGSGDGTVHLLNSLYSSLDCHFTRNHAQFGGAIFALQSQISILESSFVDNVALNNGGALQISTDSKATIDRSRFHNNIGLIGGAFYSSSDSLTTISNSIITLNYAINRGGGLYLTSGTKVEIINSNVNYNDAGTWQGSGIYNSQSDCRILNSIICCNSPSSSFGVSENYHSFSPTNSEIGHSYVEYSGGSTAWSVPNTTDLGGNIDVEPTFNWVSSGDSLAQELDCSSFLINKGNNEYNLLPLDYSGDERIVSDTIDIGAQEYQNDETELIWTAGGDGIHWEDADNWSCLRVPSHMDVVILESFDDTIVIDTGVHAIALSVNIRNSCTLLIKGDTLQQIYGSLTTNEILLSENIVQQQFGSKSSSTQDSAFFLNHGEVTTLKDGITCDQFCHIFNDYEMNLNDEGIDLIPGNCFANSGALNFNLTSGAAIKIEDSQRGVSNIEIPENLNTKRSDKSAYNRGATFFNSLNGLINITGTNIDSTRMSNNIGIDLPLGLFLNEGSINMRFLLTAIRLGEINSDSSRGFKSNVVSLLENDGTINIRDSQNGIVGEANSRLVNNSIINGIDLWNCPMKFSVGLEYCGSGEIDLWD